MAVAGPRVSWRRTRLVLMSVVFLTACGISRIKECSLCGWPQLLLLASPGCCSVLLRRACGFDSLGPQLVCRVTGVC